MTGRGQEIAVHGPASRCDKNPGAFGRAHAWPDLVKTRKDRRVADANPMETFAGEPYAYLTTIGRHTGRPHRIEIWFAVHDGRVYLMSGGRDRSDWVRNVMANGQVRFEVGGETYAGTARVVSADEDDRLARELLVAKYASPTNPLADWKKRSLPVVIEFPDAGTGRSHEEGAAQ